MVKDKKTYLCEKCGKSFNQKGHFDNHKNRIKPCKEINNKLIELKVNEKLQELLLKGYITINNKNLILQLNMSNNNNNNMNKKYTIGETFVGCGGSHFGFKKSGFDVCFVNDIWKDAIETLKLNDNDIDENIVFLEDINNLNEQYFTEKNIIPSEVNLDILLGGVVCKGFSMAGIRNPFDIRNYLYLEQLKLVQLFKPKISIIENVPGMLSMKILRKNQSDEIMSTCQKVTDKCEQFKTERANLIGLTKKKASQELINEKNILISSIMAERKVLEKSLENNMYSVVDDIIKIYEEDLGYTVYKEVLMCSDYGCATNRKRLFIVAVRNDINEKKEWTYPEPITQDNKPTVKDALDLLDLNDINNPNNDPDNVPMKHRPATIEKFKKITCDKKTGTFFSRGSASRLDYNKPAPTLVPGHSSFQLHPTEHRSITVREGAIITGFPRDFKFCGKHGDRCMQIGNAIPVHMAFNLAEHCKKFLDSV